MSLFLHRLSKRIARENSSQSFILNFYRNWISTWSQFIASRH